jgi:hypothetical protein
MLEESNEMSPTITGMVQLDGATYRVVRLGAGHYDLIRILDDVSVGTFRVGPPLELNASGVHPSLFRRIAWAAMRNARTSWMGRLSLPASIVAKP